MILFAVGNRALTKAAKAARTVWETNPANVETLLLTDAAGVAAARAWSAEAGGGLLARERLRARGGGGDDRGGVARAAPFDEIISIGNASEGVAFASMPQFQAFRAYEVSSATGREVLAKDRPVWTDQKSQTNIALRALRLAKIRALARGAALFAYSVFLDVDTVVCLPLIPSVCDLEAAGANVAFVPVTGNRTHGDALVREALGAHRWEALPAEANTGVLAMADSPTTRWLLKAWEASRVRPRLFFFPGPASCPRGRPL